MVGSSLEDFLNRKADQYNTSDFIPTDPVSIPHLFTRKQDIEIAGFFAAIFAWGHRTLIIKKSKELLQRMDYSPYDFCLHHQESDLRKLLTFRHRTFNATDLLYFVSFFKEHYGHYDSLEAAFLQKKPNAAENVEAALNGFYDYFFRLPQAPLRTKKHIAAPAKKATCKRLNMFLRWMVRNDNKGVDFGLWKQFSPAQLVCPVDVHVGRVARRFCLLQRRQTDWQAALELTENLKKFDPHDPVKYDFALFGLGIIEKY